MAKKTVVFTYDRFVSILTAGQRVEFEQEYYELSHSEQLFAAKQKKNLNHMRSVHTLSGRLVSFPAPSKRIKSSS